MTNISPGCTTNVATKIDLMLRQVLSHRSLQRLEFGEGCLEMGVGGFGDFP